MPRRGPSRATPWLRILLIAVIALVLAGGTFLYRVTTLGNTLGGFENDQFVHLSEAQQVVLGDQTPRDFITIGGMPMTVWLSAASLRYFGTSLWSEAVLTSAMIAFSTAMLFILAERASGSVLIALALALLQVAMAPRAYNYPKLLAYAAGIPLLWAYINAPSRIRLFPVALAGVFAFLLRHDHGAYFGIAAAVGVFLTHARQPGQAFKAVALLGLMALGALLPYLLYVQVGTGVVRDLRHFVEYSTWVTDRTDLNSEDYTPQLDPSKSLLVVTPQAAPNVAIGVRWAPGLPAAERTARERAHGLTPIEQRAPDVWKYRAADITTSGLRAIVRDPKVADTDGIDRSAFTITDPAYQATLSRWGRLRAQWNRVQILPGFLTRANAVPWIFLMLAAVPIGTVLLVALRMFVPNPSRDWPHELPKMTAIAVMIVLMSPGLLRGGLNSRLADVSQVAGVAAAWVLGTVLARRSNWGRWVARGVALLLCAVTAVAINANENTLSELPRTGIGDGIDGVKTRWNAVRAQLDIAPPVAAWGQEDAPGEINLSRYLNQCTLPTDRLLIVTYAPELYFMAGRGFAGGLVWMSPELFDSPQDQQDILTRIERHRVPIVLTPPEPEYSDDVARSFDALDRFLRAEYRLVGQRDFGRDRVYRVLVRRELTPVRTYLLMDLPCFARPVR